MDPDLLLFAGCLSSTLAHGSLWGGAATSPRSQAPLRRKPRARSHTAPASCFWLVTPPLLPDNWGPGANNPK